MSRDALVVGVNTYQNLPSLQAPAQDAESVARCLENFGECRVVRLPEAITHQQPVISQRGVVTTAMLEEALIKLFKPAGKNVPQTAIFYYSGHGLQRQAGIQEGYLATADANPATGHYGLSLHWLRRLLQESPVRQRVILLDCCNSGEFFNMLEADPGARAGTDRLFIAAAREYEAAYESLGGSHSVFTEALLLGLNPYKVKGGIANGHSLTDVVNRKLKGELQQPLFESSGGEIVLTRMAGLPSASRDQPSPLLDRLQKLRYGFCPFPGADPFGAAHSEFFFGRDTVTQTLVERVQTDRLCVLVGASGVGKTSLLQAGLIPRLAQADDSAAWQVRYLTLGVTPLSSLAAVFVDSEATGLRRAEQVRQAESFVQRGPEGFCQLVQAVAGDRRLVLVIDQFETLLTPGFAPERDRTQVIDCLTAALQRSHLPLHLVLGLRASHLHSLSAFPTLQTLVAEYSLAVPAMTYNEIKSTIVGPLDKVGLRYDANLIYTLLLDVVSAPANLALLQITLKELWSRREIPPATSEPPCLTLPTYAEMGGLRQLLNRRADQIYQSLSVAQQTIARRIFLSLCDFSDGSALSRRQISLAELVTETMPQAAVISTLDQLIAARLVVAQAPTDGPGGLAALAVPGWVPTATDGDAPLITGDLIVPTFPSATAVPHFDIAHEALIRNWPSLQQWLQAQGAIIRQQRAIEVAAQGWQQQQQPNHPDFFLSRTRLNEAKAFCQNHPDQLSVQANDYLKACDRYARRCRRQGHLVRLLIPLSMATGMVTAYAHSHMAHPPTALTPGAAEPTTSPVSASFELLSAPEPPPGETTPGPGAAQEGVVRTNLTSLMPIVVSWSQSVQGMAPPAPQPPSALASAEGELVPLDAAKTLTLKPVGAAEAMALDSQIGPVTSLPAANQVVELESSWVSPEDPSLIIQIWCTRTKAKPVCFTTTAAHHD
ncbi:MAG: hypothetical protein EA368_14100 [Leptolyngbya sp. DLM2.Bin27]|nr:MAG: hypothetical protein EA368_14100 [Leptolyngbya sp. DLM2.Bin27]